MTSKRLAKASAVSAAVVGMLALAGCAGDAGAAPGELTMTVWGGMIDAESAQARADLCTADMDGVSVTVRHIPEDYDTTVQTMMAGGTAPDIMQVAEGVNSFSARNQLTSLNEFIDEAGLDLYARFGPVGELYSLDGEIFALPDRSGAIILYYNADLFDAAGIERPTADWTWDDALAAMQALTVPGEQQWGFGGAGWWAQWWSFAHQNGGAIIDADGSPTVNTPEVVEALQWANDLVHVHGVVPSAADFADMGIGGDQAFFAQNVAMNMTGFWALNMLTEADFNWNIAPVWRGANQAATAFGSGLAIPRGSSNPEAAFEVISCMTDVEAQMEIVRRAQDVPANLVAQQSQEFLNPEWVGDRDINFGAFTESADFVFRSPLIPDWAEMQTVFGENLEVFWNQGGDAQERLDVIQAELERVITPADQ